MTEKQTEILESLAQDLEALSFYETYAKDKGFASVEELIRTFT